MDTSITYIHNKPVSSMSQILQSFMALAGLKNDIEKKMKKKDFSQEAASIPKSIKVKFDLNTTEINACRVWTLKPKQNVSNNVILYLHGGAYIFNITKYHWNFIENYYTKQMQG